MMKSCLLWLNVFADLLRFLVLSLRSESALAAENLTTRTGLSFTTAIFSLRAITGRASRQPSRRSALVNFFTSKRG